MTPIYRQTPSIPPMILESSSTSHSQNRIPRIFERVTGEKAVEPRKEVLQATILSVDLTCAAISPFAYRNVIGEKVTATKEPEEDFDEHPSNLLRPEIDEVLFAPVDPTLLENELSSELSSQSSKPDALQKMKSDKESDFYEKNQTKSSSLKGCESNKEKENNFREKSKEKRKDLNSEYYKKNKARVLANKSEYYKINKDRIKACSSDWSEKNKEKVKVYKSCYYEKNKERIKSLNKKYSINRKKSALSFDGQMRDQSLANEQIPFSMRPRISPLEKNTSSVEVIAGFLPLEKENDLSIQPYCGPNGLSSSYDAYVSMPSENIHEDSDQLFLLDRITDGT